MIRFVCKQCGAKINRPDDVAGSIVFCACGQQNRVPWESTEPEPLEPEPRDKSAEEPPILLTEDEEEQPRRPARRPGTSARSGRPSKKPDAVRRDPDFCFNHQDRPKTTTCADCGESFCADCSVSVRDQTLCGPCKNYRVRSLLRPRTPSVLAILSAVAGLLSCPLVFCSSFMVAAMPQEGGPGVAPGLSAALGLLPLAAILLGAFGLWQTESRPRVSGRVWAVLGMTSATAGLLWCLTLAWTTGMRGVGN